MYFAFLFIKQNQKALRFALALCKRAAVVTKYSSSWMCCFVQVLAFVQWNLKIELRCERAKIALKSSFCLLNDGLCQKPTQLNAIPGILAAALQQCSLPARHQKVRSPAPELLGHQSFWVFRLYQNVILGLSFLPELPSLFNMECLLRLKVPLKVLSGKIAALSHCQPSQES